MSGPARDELSDRGYSLDWEDLENALFDLAQHHFPHTVAADFSEWSIPIYKDVLAHLQKHYTGLSEVDKEAVDLSGADEADERMEAAGDAEGRGAFREAMREYERATLAVLQTVRGDAGETSSGRGAA